MGRHNATLADHVLGETVEAEVEGVLFRTEFTGRFFKALLPKYTGGKGESTQWVHCELFVSPETICPVVTQQVRGEFF